MIVSVVLMNGGWSWGEFVNGRRTAKRSDRLWYKEYRNSTNNGCQDQKRRCSHDNDDDDDAPFCRRNKYPQVGVSSRMCVVLLVCKLLLTPKARPLRSQY